MIVVMFQHRFAPMVRDGSKPHTIRPERKRPIRIGDQLSLRHWAGAAYRSPQVILRAAVCTAVRPISVSYSTTGRPIVLDGTLLEPAAADALAVADGFTDVADLWAWFAETHGPGPFFGVLIEWNHAASADR